MCLFPNDGCLCRYCVIASCRDGRWLGLVRLSGVSRDSSGQVLFAIGSGVYLWLCLCLPWFSLCEAAEFYLSYFLLFFFLNRPPYHRLPLTLSFSICLLLVHSYKPLLFTMEIAFYKLGPENSPITAPLCCCAIDGFPNGCRWAQGAIGTGPLECSALLINHNQSCAITSIVLVNYCEGQVVQLHTEACGMWALEKHLALQSEKEKRRTKRREENKKKVTPDTCRRLNIGTFLSVIPLIHGPCAAETPLPVNNSWRGEKKRHNETDNYIFQLWKWNPGARRPNQTVIMTLGFLGV